MYAVVVPESQLQNLNFDWNAATKSIQGIGGIGVAVGNAALADHFKKHTDQPIRHGLAQGALNIGQMALQDPQGFANGFKEDPFAASMAITGALVGGIGQAHAAAAAMRAPQPAPAPAAYP